MSLDGTPIPILQYIHQLFLAIIPVASQLLLCLFWTSLRLGIGVYNALASKKKNFCKIAQASKNLDSNAQHFLFVFANTFIIFTPCSLHSQVTNSLILSWIGVSTLLGQKCPPQPLPWNTYIYTTHKSIPNASR